MLVDRPDRPARGAGRSGRDRVRSGIRLAEDEAVESHPVLLHDPVAAPFREVLGEDGEVGQLLGVDQVARLGGGSWGKRERAANFAGSLGRPAWETSALPPPAMLAPWMAFWNSPLLIMS